MATKHFCDIEGCKQEASNLDVQMCSGWKVSSQNSFGVEISYGVFEKPIIIKKDLCDKHFKEWCRATYNTFWRVD
jgi:hypothetical protein